MIVTFPPLKCFNINFECMTFPGAESSSLQMPIVPVHQSKTVILHYHRADSQQNGSILVRIYIQYHTLYYLAKYKAVYVHVVCYPPCMLGSSKS